MSATIFQSKLWGSPLSTQALKTIYWTREHSSNLDEFFTEHWSGVSEITRDQEIKEIRKQFEGIIIYAKAT